MNKTDIASYKNQIIRDILFNSDESLSADVVNAIDKNYFGNESELIYQNIFPYLRIPETQTETKCYITMSVDIPKVSTKNYFFKQIIITLNVIVHEDLMKMDDSYNSTRADYIDKLLNKIFNGNENYGSNALEYVSDVESVLLNKYFVRTLRYTCEDVNSENCSM